MAYAVGHISGGRFSLYTILNGAGAFTTEGAGAFATNFYEMEGYAGRSYSMGAAFSTEFLLTAFFLIINIGSNR